MVLMKALRGLFYFAIQKILTLCIKKYDISAWKAVGFMYTRLLTNGQYQKVS
jgi:hypothetical protein